MKKNLNHAFAGLLLAGLLLAGFTSSAYGKTFYVSAGAADGDGSAAKPFAALEAARDAARPFVGKEPVEIVVKAGTYRLPESFLLTEADSGTKEAPVVYRSEVKHGARLNGAVKLDGARFAPVTENAILERLPEVSRDKVRVFDLTSAGVQSLSQLGNHAVMPIGVPELFVNGKRMKMACWPNEGWATVAEIVDGGSRGNSGLASDAAKMKNETEAPRGGTFRYTEDAPNRWNAANGVWLWGYWCFDWFDDILKVESIDPSSKQIKFAGQSVYGLRQGNPSPRRWKAIHLLEELDLPGEYYVDFQTLKLYYFPETDPALSEITLAFRNQAVVQMQKASHVTLDGFVVEESFSSGINCTNSSYLTVQNCVVRNTRSVGVVSYGGAENQFLSNLIQFNGAGGLHIYSGDRKTLTRGNCLAANNTIHDFAVYRLCYANGLTLSGVGHTARHNELFNAPHQAVSLGGNDMLFELNVIHHVCLTGDDAAACYKGRNPSARGNVIRWNYWYDIGSPRGHGNAAVYFDDGDGGEMVFGNLFVNCGDPGKGSFGTIFCHGGHGNFARNNIFVDCKRPLGSSPWNDKRWKEYIDAPLWQTRLTQEVDIRSEVYLKAYPELKNFLDGAPIEQRQNYASQNVFIRPEKEKTGTWQIDETNVFLDRDPGFVDAENGNYELREDSEIFRLIPGFQPIPFSKMGPVKE